MDSAETSRAHEADSDGAACGQRAADRRRADGPLNERGGQIARAHLASIGPEACELVLRDAYAEQAVEHADRRGHRAGSPHAPLALEPDGNTLARWKPVGDEGCLERHDGPPLRERAADLVGDSDQVLHGMEPSFATQRDAASSASSRPPT